MSDYNPLPVLQKGVGDISKCQGDKCETCSVNDLCTRDCTENTLQKSCQEQCADCGGGFQRGQWSGKYATPAVCCRSPLATTYMDMVRRDSYKFTKRSPMVSESKAVTVFSGTFAGMGKGAKLYPENISTVGVTLKHVWTMKGWVSQDLRDYLRIPEGVRLVLFTNNADAMLERAWTAELYEEDFESLGFDMWETIGFSQFADYSNFYNIWMGFRSMWAGARSGSHFSQPLPLPIDAAKDASRADLWREWSENVPQLMVNWQFTSVKSPDLWRRMVAEFKQGLKYMTGVKSLWFQGVSSPVQIYNLKLAFANYDCYFTSVTPWRRAQQGDYFSSVGKGGAVSMPRRELLLRNQENYATLVARSVTDAASAALS